jgi:uncharacterized protein (TIGR02217 family)
MVDFIDVRLPEDIERGAKGGPRFKTTVIGLNAGGEQRNADWSQQKCEFDVSYGVRNKDDWQEVLDHFYMVQGRAIGFRFKDWSDFEATTNLFGTGDGSEDTFPLYKSYGTSPNLFFRRITRPISAISIYVNDVLKTVTTHYTVNYSTGVVTFTAGNEPANGATIKWTGEFDIPVRFNTDALDIELIWEDAGSVPQLTLVEIPE